MSAKKPKFTFGFIIGWAFVILAFLGAAHEASVGERGIISAQQLWYAKDPGSFVVAKREIIQLLGNGGWEYGVALILALPVWAIFGIPAGLLLWFFRPHKEKVDWDEVEAAHDYADMLARMAKEDGAKDDSPSWADLDELDDSEHPEIQKLNKNPIDHYMDQWVPDEVEDAELEGLVRGSEKDIRKPGDIGRKAPGIHELGDLKLGDGKGRRKIGEMPDLDDEN